MKLSSCYLFKRCSTFFFFSTFSLLIILHLLAFAAHAANLYDPISVYLTWQRNPESTMTVQWISLSSRKQDIVEYRRSDETAWQRTAGRHLSLPGPSGYLVHRVELTDLTPHTAYTFRTGSDAVAYKFRTMPADDTTPIRFVVGGDMYHDSLEILEKTNRQAAKTNPDFALVGGDIAYAANSQGALSESFHSWAEWALSDLPVISNKITKKRQRWIDWIVAWKNQMVTTDGRLIPMLPALGNHDVNGGYGQPSKQAIYFHTLFAMPGKQGYNVLDFGHRMCIVILDTGHTNTICGWQTQWLNQALSDRQHFPLKFALYHVPAFPSIRNPNSKYCALARKCWVPLFEKYNLTAAFEHHDHNYKRSYPIRNGKIDPTGVLYLGDGAWGVDAPRVRKKNHPIPWYISKMVPRRHFILVTIVGNIPHFTAIDTDGIIFDET